MKNKFNMFDFVNISILLLISIITLYPIWHVIVRSLLPYDEAVKNAIVIFPKKITFDAYKYVLSSNELIRGFGIAAFTTVCTTVYNLTMTSMAGFALSKRDLPYRKLIFYIAVFTMFFGGGLIPTYLQIKRLHLIDNLLVLILPSGISAYNLIIMKSFMEELPEEIQEAATIDGAGYGTIFFKIVLPLSKPVLATIALFVAVGTWNSWYNAMLYLNDRNLWPIAYQLREILVNSSTDMAGSINVSDSFLLQESIKMAVVVISIIPIMAVYPFLQKHFAKGVMIGAVKG